MKAQSNSKRCQGLLASDAASLKACFVIHTSPFLFKGDFLKKNLFIYFIYFWLHWVFVAVLGFSLPAASGGYSVAVHGLLIAVASLVVEQGL